MTPLDALHHLFSDPAALVREYGYWAVFFGTLLEGETVVLLAGFLAHQGYLYPPLVVLAAFSGTVISDQTMFFLGRYKGGWLLGKFPRLASGLAKLGAVVRTREIPLILSFRFMYGLRNVTPIFLGINRTSPLLFIPLNAASAAVWAAAFTFGGYFSGQALRTLFEHARAYELPAIALIIGIGITVHLMRKKP